MRRTRWPRVGRAAHTRKYTVCVLVQPADPPAGLRSAALCYVYPTAHRDLPSRLKALNMLLLLDGTFLLGVAITGGRYGFRGWA